MSDKKRVDDPLAEEGHFVLDSELPTQSATKLPSDGVLKFKNIEDGQLSFCKLKQKGKESEKLKINYLQLPERQPKQSDSSSQIGPSLRGKKEFAEIIYKGSGSRIQDKNEQILRSTYPWSLDVVLNYQQVQIQTLTDQKSYFWIGITSMQPSDNGRIKYSVPGTLPNSIGLKISSESKELQVHQNGQKFLDSAEDDAFSDLKKLQNGDCIGCGFCPFQQYVFFTLNGKKLTPNIKIIPYHEKQAKPSSVVVTQYYPTVAFLCRFPLSFNILFDNCWEHFNYNYKVHYDGLQRKLIKYDILDHVEPCALKLTGSKFEGDLEADKYNIVKNYLRFHGYDKTAEGLQLQMKRRNLKFKRANRPVKNGEKYEKKFNEEFEEFAKQGKEKKIKKEERRRKRNLQKKANMLCQKDVIGNSDDVSISQSILLSSQNSDSSNSSEQYCYDGFMKRGEILPDDMMKSRKKIENERQRKLRKQKEKKQSETLIEKQRLDRFYSYIKKMKESQERLFNKERVGTIMSITDVVRYIQAGKLDICWKALEKDFPKILEDEPYLKVYFKAVTFMKLCVEEGVAEGLKFIKGEHKEVQKYQNCLFPFYKEDAVNKILTTEFRPLRQIVFIICPDFQQKFSLTKQLRVFSEFMGKLICQKMGFIGKSDIEIIFEHFQAVKDEIQRNGIPAGGLKLQ